MTFDRWCVFQLAVGVFPCGHHEKTRFSWSMGFCGFHFSRSDRSTLNGRLPTHALFLYNMHQSTTLLCQLITALLNEVTTLSLAQLANLVTSLHFGANLPRPVVLLIVPLSQLWAATVPSYTLPFSSKLPKILYILNWNGVIVLNNIN